MATLFTSNHSIGTYGYIRGYSSYSVNTDDPTNVVISVSAVGENLGSTSQYSSTYSISGSWAVSVSCNGSSLGSYSGSGARSASVSSSSPYYIDRDGGATRSITIAKGTSSKTATLSLQYSAGSSTYTGSVVISVPAKSKYTITYDANGGTQGSITSQSYYYGDSFTVSTNATPTRDGYTFLGWSVSSSATSATYIPGSTYSNLNASATWYAVWQQAAPTITYVNSYRVDDVGSTHRDDEGTVGYVMFERAGSFVPSDISVTINGETQHPSTISGTSGTEQFWFSNLSVDTEYQVNISVTDSGGTVTARSTISKSTFPIDVDPSLQRIDFGYDVNFVGNVTHNGEAIGGMITIDTEMSSTSHNPVENKVITEALSDSQLIPIGNVTSVTGANGAKVFHATVDGITEFQNGRCIYIKNGSTASTAGWTLNVNELGAKPVYNSMSGAVTTSTYAANSTYLFVYNADRVNGGCWDMYYGYDSNTNTLAYNIRNYQSTLVAKNAIYRYMFVFTTQDDLAVPSCVVKNSTSVSKALTTEKFDPFAPIYYYAATGDVAAGDPPAASSMYTMYHACNMRYGFNVSTTDLELKKAVYIRCVPQSDGTAKLDGDDCVVQDLPNSADGKIYIYLGRAYSAYQIDMPITHPVYYYSGGRIREWTGADTPMIFYDTSANWDAQTTLVGNPGCMYVYTDVNKVKIGDGQAYLIDNPFVSDFVDEVDDHINNTDIHITAAERLFWNNKVRCYYDIVNRETLVFTTN